MEKTLREDGMNPGMVIIRIVVGGFIWWLILGAVLKDQQLEFTRVALWYGLAWVVGLGVKLLGEYVFDWPELLILLLPLLARVLVIFVCLRIEYRAWNLRRIQPAVLVYSGIELVLTAPALFRALTA